MRIDSKFISAFNNDISQHHCVHKCVRPVENYFCTCQDDTIYGLHVSSNNILFIFIPWFYQVIMFIEISVNWQKNKLILLILCCKIHTITLKNILISELIYGYNNRQISNLGNLSALMVATNQCYSVRVSNLQIEVNENTSTVPKFKIVLYLNFN